MPARKKSPGLYANIHAKQERIAHGSGETMNKAGSAGAPTKAAFDAAAKTEQAPARKSAAKKATPARKSAARKTR